MIRSNQRRSGSTLSAKPCIVVPAATRTPIADLALDPLASAASQTPAAPDPTGAEAVFGEHGDQGLFKPSYVVNDEHRFG